MYQYTLEPYTGLSSRYDCPGCGKVKEFTRYIDLETNQPLASNVGKCNRVDNCGYHKTPKQHFEDNGDIQTPVKKPFTFNKEIKPKPVSFIEFEIFKESMNVQNYGKNNFVKFLNSLFGQEITDKLIEKYFIGTSNHWNGATVFWQRDKAGKIRTGKIILYDHATGKRRKKPHKYINWVHSVYKLPEFELKQCLFGEHLLKDNSKTVAIVESEKTAIIASVYFPQMLWLAVGSLTYLTMEMCKVLVGSNVVLYPDINGFESWSKKAVELSCIANFTVSEFLEKIATEEERKQSLDIADYLIKYNINEVGKPITVNPVPDIMTTYLTELATMSVQFNAGELPPDDWNIYNSEFENRLRAAGINLNEFVHRSLSFKIE